MTSNDRPATTTVTPLRRPPVRQATLVRSDRAHTFDVFVRTIGVWWPVQPISAGRDRVREVTFEPRVGGRVYETWTDGTTVDWGTVIAWDPPARLVMTWTATPAPTEVQDVHAIGSADPAVKGNVAMYRVYAMPGATVRGAPAGSRR
jgi:uncharacterized protein YndB with AHSA1/START domain